MKSPIDKNIILASNSPRRRQLLREIIPDFEIAPAREIDEVYPSNLPVTDIALYLSRLKAEAYSDLLNHQTILITADTVVIADGQLLGKPHSEEEAIEMLKKISGVPHQVVTGVTIKSTAETETFGCTTTVYFDHIPEDDIIEYVREYKPYDKAGSYGIQEWIGCRGITRIEGCFYNVMGLPLNSLYEHLVRFGRDGDKA